MPSSSVRPRRPNAPGVPSPSRSPVDGARQANASIWPIQLRDRGVGPSLSTARPDVARRRLTHVPLSHLDFEDVSFYLNFALLVDQHQLTHVKLEDAFDLDSNGTGAKRKRSPSEVDLSGVSSNAKKKGKAVVERHLARDRASLIETSCYFHTKAREAQDIDRILSLKQALQGTSTFDRPAIGELDFSVLSCTSIRPDDSIISHVISLRHRPTGQLVAELPVLTTVPPLEPDSDLGNVTNGEWLASLSNVLTRNASKVNESLTASFTLEVTSPPSGFPPDRTTAGSLFLKLSIQVGAPISTDPVGPLARDSILDMAKIVHFADQWPDRIDTSQSVDASFVYQNLRPASIEALDCIQHADLVPTLLPFQKRSTAFVLGREGLVLNSGGRLVKSDKIIGHDGQADLGLWWKQIAPGLFYNWIEARFVRDHNLTLHSDFKGAMLAEEMGLGKTVEAVALMLLNPDSNASSRVGWYDERNQINVVPTKTTLIVAPESLRAQWIEEIAQHAPGLAVYSYLGRTKAEDEVPEGLTWESWAQRFDVMVISYSLLSKELGTAKAVPERSRRHQRKYERPRSPLVKLHFHRVLMDEVQMIGSGNAAETVSMISRGSSIAISGTPVKKIEDLKSCFRFLRVPGYLATPQQWQALLHPCLAPALVRVLRTIGTRHTKTQVASEMSLPLQTRAVIPIDFTSIEAAFYADVWKDGLTDIAYTQDGDPQILAQQPDVGKMRQHLLLLRQACTHPQVAVQFRPGVVGSRNLRSIDEVLELMIDSTRTELHSSRTFWFDRRIHRNILALYRRREDQRVVAALQLQDVEDEINKDVRILEQEIDEASTVGPLYRFTQQELELEQKAEVRRRRLDADNTDEDRDGALEALVGDRQAYLVLVEKRKARATHIIQLRSLLRNLLMKLHRLLQFVGNLYFQRGEYLDEQEKEADQRLERDAAAVSSTSSIETATIKLEADDGAHRIPLAANNTDNREQDAKPETVEVPSDNGGSDTNELALPTPIPTAQPPLSAKRQTLKDKEDQAYAKAEKVRHRLLTEAREVVETAIAKLKRGQVQMDAKAIQASDELFRVGGGILSHESYQTLTDSADLLNVHAEVLFAWRESIVTRLVRPVNRDVSLEREDDDQYQENLDTQAEAEVLLEMYRPLLSEREKILKGNVAVGATDKPRLFKEIEAAVRVARSNSLRGIVDPDMDEELLRVQQQQLEQFKKLEQERQSVSLSGLSVSFLEEAERLRNAGESSFSVEETTLARQAYVHARRIVSEQMKHLDKLRNEEKTLLTSLFNARSQYFKEIQVISDTVRDPLFVDLEKAIRATQKEEADLVSKVDELERRLRYLTHLQKVQSADQLDEAAKMCNICTDPIEIGILTNKCGHVCCENCWKEWQSQGHRTCVLCQTRVLPNEVHRIVYSSNKAKTLDGQVGSAVESRASSQLTANGRSNANPLAVQYNELDDSLRSTLNRLASQGRFGSKIDHVTKHVQHIIERTGEKSLIFSSFGRGLDVVAQSLTANGIRHVRITGAGKLGSEAAKCFSSDPSVHVMLLHSEAQSSGLNLLAASHIHILEPLLNTSLELQAIGRVHRIGQTKETNIWCYYVKDTVEERILALSAYKGQSLYLKGRHTSMTDSQRTLEASASASSPASAMSSTGTAAEISKEDAKKWSAFGKSDTTGSRGTMRGDATSNSTELLACYFARYLPRLGRVPVSDSQRPTAISTVRNGTGVDSKTGEQTATNADRDESREQNDELARLRRARLAALDRR
ncbi:hypothetical protein EX895_004082 [Sporisorium graminicola]|uniref:RING-type domain-containing protein n=1 Tax=Sporisorium graminicola TaxID=280036 RepID=A0A4U7KS68_9BASI|nr:hypothetical protein EX895_004082 [Sporisorium graminicola]TKY87405.1 hypothetical protein EX895_004082 [Sporisorium graminicola]